MSLPACRSFSEGGAARKNVKFSQIMSVERSAGIILFRNTPEGRRYLVIRSSRDHAKLTPKKTIKEFWDFPKGRLEEKETGMKAAIRESREEVGIEAEPTPKFKETVRYFTWREGKPIPKFVALFLAESPTEKVTLSWEHDAFEWLSFSEAKERISLSQMKQALEKAEEFLRNH